MAYNDGRGQDYGGGHQLQDLPAGGNVSFASLKLTAI